MTQTDASGHGHGHRSHLNYDLNDFSDLIDSSNLNVWRPCPQKSTGWREEPFQTYSATVLDDAGQCRHRQLLGRQLWLGRPDIKHVVCQLSTHVGTATTRDEINIKRLLGHLVGNPACNMVVGCNFGCSWNCGYTAKLCLGDD